MQAKNVILIYANCVNPTAKGDYSFAGNIAKDLTGLTEAIRMSENLTMRLPIDDIILVSSGNGLAQFIALYGTPNEHGRIMIDGHSIGLCSLNEFNPIHNHVIAFIEANRCAPAPAQFVKRVISPDTKFLFIDNANQPAIMNAESQSLHKEQPGLYEGFDNDDFFFASAGFGANRIGFPSLTERDHLKAVTPEESQCLPKGPYGFIYASASHDSFSYNLIAQYLYLLQEEGEEVREYVLVGEFANKQKNLAVAYKLEIGAVTPLPKIHYHQSLPNHVMRRLIAEADTPLVVSTGVTSTLEVMQEGKLCFYQALRINENFVMAYLSALHNLLIQDQNLLGPFANKIFGLGSLLFFRKPLPKEILNTLAKLLDMDDVREQLIAINRTLLQQAKGALAPSILSFIQKPNATQAPKQLEQALVSLRKPDENSNPSIEEAFMRVAFDGDVFTMKILLNAYPNLLNVREPMTGNTALHWSVMTQRIDCILLLLQHGAFIDIANKRGKTPLHCACMVANSFLVMLLLNTGSYAFALLTNENVQLENNTPNTSDTDTDTNTNTNTTTNKNSKKLLREEAAFISASTSGLLTNGLFGGSGSGSSVGDFKRQKRGMDMAPIPEMNQSSLTS
jgi:hypothetical protein